MLKKVDDINHVWNKIKKGSRLPFLLHFKITDSITMKQGHLQIVDLLQPPFAPPDTPDKYTLHNSFSQLGNYNFQYANRRLNFSNSGYRGYYHEA